MKASIEKIRDVLGSKNLTIPPYQRPYRWTEKNILSLLKDIYASYIVGKNSYRLGSLILHKDDNNHYIVDGQQRITTLLLLFKTLNSHIGKELRGKLEYSHNDSKYHIKNNFTFISKWINENIVDKDSFTSYVANHCEFVVITTKDISEAFQMFDSQNTRGKDLEPYNLLKAYHIRAMERESQEIKIIMDQKWEEATIFKKDITNEEYPPKDILKQLFAEQLYRTRKWSKKVGAYRFNKDEIDEFKGENIFDKIQYPHQNKLLLQLFAKSLLNKNQVILKGTKKRILFVDSEFINPFVQINQRIINGKNFFEYILTYTELYKILFEDIDNGKTLKDFKDFYHKHCIYAGAYRNGDSYLREIYKSAIFLIFDRFGEDGVRKFHKTLYSLIFRIRLEKFQVKYDALAKNGDIIQMFWEIENAKDYFDLEELYQLEKKFKPQIQQILVAIKQNQKKIVKGIDNIINFFYDRFFN